LKHEVRLAFGNNFRGIRSDCPADHDREATAMFDAARFEQYFTPC